MSKPDKKAANQKPGKIVLLPVEQIEPSPFQARTAFDETEIAALAVSILQNGLLQPISVRKTGYHKYQLVAGERRLRAARIAGLREVPCLLVSADEAAERVRGILGALITAGVVYLLSRVMPSEPENIILDPVYACGVAGGIVGYVLGRSRRGAFISGVMGVLLADLITAIVVWAGGVSQSLTLGGAGIFDTAVISGIIAVLLAAITADIGARGAGQRRCAQLCPRTYAAKGER